MWGKLTPSHRQRTQHTPRTQWIKRCTPIAILVISVCRFSRVCAWCRSSNVHRVRRPQHSSLERLLGSPLIPPAGQVHGRPRLASASVIESNLRDSWSNLVKPGPARSPLAPHAGSPTELARPSQITQRRPADGASLLGHALGSQRHIKPPLRVLSAASSVSGCLRSACPRQVSTHLWIWIPRRRKPVRPARRALRKHTIYPVLGVARAKAAMQHLESLLSLHNKVDRCRRRRALVLQRLLVLKRHGEHLAVRVRARLDGAAAATMMMAAHPKRNGRDGDDNSNQPGCRGYDGDGNRAGQHQQRRGRRRVGSVVEQMTFHGHGSHARGETLSRRASGLQCWFEETCVALRELFLPVGVTTLSGLHF